MPLLTIKNSERMTERDILHVNIVLIRKDKSA